MSTKIQPDWDQLLMRSEELVQQDFSFPRVERDIMQIEQFSQKLRSKAVRGDPTTETLDANRLLAQEGLNPRKINQALQTFELRPTYEDVFRVETATVDEYLQQVHEVIAATAVQEAQRSAINAFENHMDVCMNADWARDKKALLDSIEPFSSAIGTGGGGNGPLTASGLFQPGRIGRPFPPSSSSSAAAISGGNDDRKVLLRGRAAKYADVVRKINASLSSGHTYHAVDGFAAACIGDTTGGSEKRTTIQRVWNVVQRQLEGVYSISTPHQQQQPSSLSSSSPYSWAARTRRETLLVAGARKYLEENFLAYMQAVVNTHRAQAALGGNPGRIGLVHAYLRVREKDRGPLDFDRPGGADTCWLRIYTCLRAGFINEACQIARGLGDGGASAVHGTAATDTFSPPPSSSHHLPSLGGRDTFSLLSEWNEGGNTPLTGDGYHAAHAEAERLLRDTSARGREGHLPHRIMVHALLAGSNRIADAIAREFPAFFPTIEDYLWLKLGLVRPGGRSVSAASAGLETYSLSDLQKYLRQYPPSHYSHGGREPLLYVVVLLLSLQLHAAVEFLATDASAKDYRLDAVHLGACLWHAHAITESIVDGTTRSPSSPLSDSSQRALSVPTKTATEQSSTSVGHLIHQYARSLIHGDVCLALEYYMLAAAVQGGSLTVKGSLLRELLIESKAYGLLLGAGGTVGEGSALASFLPDPMERSRVLEAMASQCAEAAQLEEAVELYMVAGRPRHALHILCRQLSEVVEYAAIDASKKAGEDSEVYIARGNAAVDALRRDLGHGDDDAAAAREIEAFEQLKIIRTMLSAAAHGDRVGVLHSLVDLSFVPTDQYRLPVCSSQAATSLHPALAERLQAVVLAGAEALAASSKWNELHVIVAFAAAVPNRISRTAYQKLNQLQAAGVPM